MSQPVSLSEQALALYADGQYGSALALATEPVAPLLNIAGLAAYQLGEIGEAEKYWNLAVAARPDYAEAHNNLGELLRGAGRPAEAEAAYLRALAARPGYAEALNNLGILYLAERRLAEAEAALRRALAARPAYPEAWSNLGVWLKGVGRHQEAEAAYRQALALQPGNPDACFNLAFLLLMLGRYAEAWPLYELRHDPRRVGQAAMPKLPFPVWQGEPLRGKSLLLWHEQGFGDVIQFCRFVPLLKALGASRIGLVCKPPLAILLSTLAGLDALHPEDGGRGWPAYDYWTFPMSVPFRIGLELGDIPAGLPYLHALPERIARWQARLPQARPRVGLVWKSQPGRSNADLRSLPGLAALAPLWSVPGIVFVSLQKSGGEDEARQPPPGQPLPHLGSDITDFADTAAIVAQLDLVICVDTAIAHLAGALGKPCWVLLPWQADWRWLLERDDSPWYPGVLRLFRQPRMGDWEGVVGAVAQALRQWREGL